MRYRIAELVLDVDVPGIGLPTFVPFVYKGDSGSDMTVSETAADLPAVIRSAEKLNVLDNDLGCVALYRAGEEYYVSDCIDGCHTHYMSADRTFSRIGVMLDREDAGVSYALTALLRIAFSQMIIPHGGFTIHASAVVEGGLGYLFLGHSGTGKSTHTRLWMKRFEGSWLLNDDNPACRVIGGRTMAYGTPWSGSTECYINASVPVGGIARLAQAPANRWESLSGVAAWAAIFPSCALISQDEMLYLQVMRTLNRVVASVNVGRLECLPDGAAAELSHDNLKNKDLCI